ncbi:MAG TPA: cupin domain-containing protein, partial [Candidatus Polarisedimenticolia bacterium]|nr:cupin domain-containing protein [Candidatus Polarisedimenticolia bacterium]
RMNGDEAKARSAPRVHVLRGAAGRRDLTDWGPLPPFAAGPGATAASRTAGILLYGGGGTYPEAGLWECTPGRWECRVARDEFCCFLAGRSVYTHESGERTEVAGGDAAFFPAGWNGTCEVLETVRKVYLVR